MAQNRGKVKINKEIPSTFAVVTGVILRLGVPKLIVFASWIGYQFLVGALLDDSAIVEHGDFIAEFAGG